jgi:glutamyl-tRNA reductase
MHRIGVVGISYRHTSLEDVARFAIPKTEVLARLEPLREAVQASEVLYLGTCNRVEVVFALREGVASDRRKEVFRALTGREPRDGEAASILRTWTGEAAVEHLFLVACGLDSAQAGEQEIAIQLRAAWQDARATQVCGPALDRIVSEALSMARLAHRIGQRDAPSLADLAVERVMAHLNGSKAEVALVGVSPMTRRCGKRLRDRGVQLIVVNRSLDAAHELAGEISARALELDEFRSQPADCAALVCATATSEPVLDKNVLARLAARPRAPLVIDFGLPANIDPQVARAVGLTRIGMNDLVQAAQDTRVAHLMRLAPVRSAIDERLARLRAELAARAIGPQLAQMRDMFERIVAAEMDKLLKAELHELDEDKQRRLQSWATTLAHRLAHLPLSGMRAAAEHFSVEAMEAFFREARLSRHVDADSQLTRTDQES